MSTWDYLAFYIAPAALPLPSFSIGHYYVAATKDIRSQDANGFVYIQVGHFTILITPGGVNNTPAGSISQN